MKDFFTYEGRSTREISFPLGGIGSGCIGLAGNGGLIDAEIFNRPNKGSHLGFTHFAVKAERDGEVLDARVLRGDEQPPYSGRMNRPMYSGFGFGPDRETLAGLPHFRNCTFRGTFPVAEISFSDEHFPGKALLRAFNPFIPLKEDDSSVPGAFFEIEIENTGEEALTYTICFSATNLYTKKGGRHSAEQKDGLTVLTLRGDGSLDSGDPAYGDMSIGTDGKQVSCTRYWYRGNWFDDLMTYWKDFRRPGPLQDRNYEGGESERDTASLAVTLEAAKGETVRARFVLTWSTPNCENFWNPGTGETATGAGCDSSTDITDMVWKNYYATLWEDSRDSAFWSLREFPRLKKETQAFLDALLSSSLPERMLEAVVSNLAVIKSPTLLRLTDGSLYGFEGCHWNEGSCEGTCTHVWSYTYAIPFLFPKLERSMRTLEYTYSMNPDGSMSFRLMLPPGRRPMQFRPCVDGQYGTVMRVWREYLISGDKEWLASLWPEVRRSIEFAWSEENSDRWDRNRDGVMEGRQHHTLDMELFGENAWLTGMYLGGLKAGALIARELGDDACADDYEALFEKGKKRLNSDLFNGEYFIQKIDLTDRSVLEPYGGGAKSLHGKDIMSAYWNAEKGEIAYQIGEGCGIDQVLAQWHAEMIGLGEIFEKEKVHSALQAVYRYNYKDSMREHFNPCRLYALNDEAGTIICSFPPHVQAPQITITYAEEAMHGFEYQSAAHMLREGMIKESMDMVAAIRDRYDGEKRNPWNEMECGSNYARSMASFSLLLAYAGFRYNAAEGMIGFAPVGGTAGEDAESFRTFWSLDHGWGTAEITPEKTVIRLSGGNLPLKVLRLTGPYRKAADPAPEAGLLPVRVIADGREIPFSLSDGDILLNEKITVADSVEVLWR